MGYRRFGALRCLRLHPEIYSLGLSIYLTLQSLVIRKAANIKLPDVPVFVCGIALGYGLDDRGFEFRQGLGIFLFTTASRMALGPTQPPIQWVPGALSLEVKRPGREADHSPPSSTEVKNAWSCTFTPHTP
jgi:hypothetical protein